MLVKPFYGRVKNLYLNGKAILPNGPSPASTVLTPSPAYRDLTLEENDARRD